MVSVFFSLFCLLLFTSVYRFNDILNHFEKKKNLHPNDQLEYKKQKGFPCARKEKLTNRSDKAEKKMLLLLTSKEMMRRKDRLSTSLHLKFMWNIFFYRNDLIDISNGCSSILCILLLEENKMNKIWYIYLNLCDIFNICCLLLLWRAIEMW